MIRYLPLVYRRTLIVAVAALGGIAFVCIYLHWNLQGQVAWTTTVGPVEIAELLLKTPAYVDRSDAILLLLGTLGVIACLLCEPSPKTVVAFGLATPPILLAGSHFPLAPLFTPLVVAAGLVGAVDGEVIGEGWLGIAAGGAWMWLICVLIAARLLVPGRRAHECVRCGYDLTGLYPDRCPECGVRQNPGGCARQ